MKSHFIIVLLAVILLSGAASAQSYEFEPLNFNAGCVNPAFGICSFGRGINNRGDVVGWGSSGVLGPEGSVVGFKLDKKGNLTTVEYPGAAETRASGINDHGDIVGEYVLPTSLHNFSQAFIRESDGSYRDISFPGAVASAVWGINNRGQAVGEYRLATDGPGVEHAYISNPDGSFVSFDFPAILIPAGTLGFTRFRDINDHGEIVGYYRELGGGFVVLLRGFLLDKKGRITAIDFPVGPPVNGENDYRNLVHGITNNGLISGGYAFFVRPAFVEHGFVRNKKGVFTTVDFPGASITEIYKSSERGDLVGGARDLLTGQSNAFVAHPVGPKGLSMPSPKAKNIERVNNTFPLK